jgi:hypothetical protein
MQIAAPQDVVAQRSGIRFDRNEWSGAFGDIGTDFPLIVGMILAAHLDPASVLIVFRREPHPSGKGVVLLGDSCP